MLLVTAIQIYCQYKLSQSAKLEAYQWFIKHFDQDNKVQFQLGF